MKIIVKCTGVELQKPFCSRHIGFGIHGDKAVGEAYQTIIKHLVSHISLRLEWNVIGF